jgi:hypothetical protein
MQNWTLSKYKNFGRPRVPFFCCKKCKENEEMNEFVQNYANYSLINFMQHILHLNFFTVLELV